MKKLLCLFLLSVGALAQAPASSPITATTAPVARMANPYTICGEGCTITAMPIGTVWQFGKDETMYNQTDTWLPAQVSTATNPVLPFYVFWTDWPERKLQ